MLNKEKLSVLNIAVLCVIFFSCSSQEYTTAKLAIQQQDFVKAAEWLPKAMAIEPNNPEIPVIMGVEIHAKDREWKKMHDMFEQALSIDNGKEIEVRGRYITVKKAVEDWRDHLWSNEFNKGVEEYRKINNDIENKEQYIKTAIQYFQDAILIKPSEAQTYSTISKMYYEIGDNQAAKEAALTSVQKNPESFDENFNAGQIISRAGGTKDQVLALYEKAVTIKPSSSKALRELASLYYDMGNKEKSIMVFENAIKNEEDKIVKADLFFNLGVIHTQMQNYSEAEKAFEEAHFLNEEDFEAALGIASSYEGLGDKYFNGSDGFEKDSDEASRWYRKAQKKIKSVMMVDTDNNAKYKKQLELLRYKRDVAAGK